MTLCNQLTSALYEITKEQDMYNNLPFSCLTFLSTMEEHQLPWYETHDSIMGGHITYAQSTEYAFGHPFRVTYKKPYAKATSNYYQNFFTFGNEYYDTIVKSRTIKWYDGVCLDPAFDMGGVLSNWTRSHEYVRNVLKCATLSGHLRSEIDIFEFNDACYDILGISLKNPLCILDNDIRVNQQ
jgi:hypothetical protein